MSFSMRAAVAATAVSGALAASVLAPAPAQAQATKVVSRTAVSVYGYYFNTVSGDYSVSFLGRVRATKKSSVCRKGRTVRFSEADGSPLYGTAKSDGAGVWQVTFDPEGVGGSEPVFRASVARKVVKKKGVKIVCKAASTVYTVAPA